MKTSKLDFSIIVAVSVTLTIALNAVLSPKQFNFKLLINKTNTILGESTIDSEEVGMLYENNQEIQNIDDKP